MSFAEKLNQSNFSTENVQFNIKNIVNALSLTYFVILSSIYFKAKLFENQSE